MIFIARLLSHHCPFFRKGMSEELHRACIVILLFSSGEAHKT